MLFLLFVTVDLSQNVASDKCILNEVIFHTAD